MHLIILHCIVVSQSLCTLFLEFMDSFWHLFFFLVLFFIITPATPQPQPQSCNATSICNYHSSSSSSSSSSNPNKFGNHNVSEPNIRSSHDQMIDSITAQVYNGDGDDDYENSDDSAISIQKAHGILSGIGWGILMPIGAMVARYLKAFSFGASRSSWFNLHRACQILAYITGTTGVALGIYAGVMSEQFSVHGYIGFAIFFAATIQTVLALNYRPKEDDKNRIFWNILHYLVGYGVIVLAIFDMFKGFSISSSYHHHHGAWKNAYLGIIVSLGCVALILEVTTWFLVCKNRKKKKKELEDDEEEDENSNE